jgi:hypothetical protein
MSREVIEGQLMAIEHAWGIRIGNRGQLAEWIGESLSDPVEILSLTTSLNTWMAFNQPVGTVQVSRPLFEKMLASIRPGERRRE